MLPSTFKPRSLSVYAQHSRGLWQPTNGNNSSVFVIMMATRNNVEKYDWTTRDDVAPLAHCATLADAHKNIQALALQYKNATRVCEVIEHGHHFKIVGKHKTRTIWIQEVGHARSLKLIDLDDIDGGVHEDCIGNDQVENEKFPLRSSSYCELGAETDASALTASDLSG
ncbi:hypothetical protein N0V86_006184 [Didymella sp. IMI 355093]|nr:hypothetical protein N0V86_006184 [Didymella sp. IMI 355093]